MGQHAIKKCRLHGNVIGSRCRCIGPHAIFWVDCDSKCPPPPPKMVHAVGSGHQDQSADNADLNRLRRTYEEWESGWTALGFDAAESAAAEYVAALTQRAADLEDRILMMEDGD